MDIANIIRNGNPYQIQFLTKVITIELKSHNIGNFNKSINKEINEGMITAFCIYNQPIKHRNKICWLCECDNLDDVLEYENIFGKKKLIYTLNVLVPILIVEGMLNMKHYLYLKMKIIIV